MPYSQIKHYLELFDKPHAETILRVYGRLLPSFAKDQSVPKEVRDNARFIEHALIEHFSEGALEVIALETRDMKPAPENDFKRYQSIACVVREDELIVDIRYEIQHDKRLRQLGKIGYGKLAMNFRVDEEYGQNSREALQDIWPLISSLEGYASMQGRYKRAEGLMHPNGDIQSAIFVFDKGMPILEGRDVLAEFSLREKPISY
ncbi:MAG TPA: hypothetical protein VFF28_03460 [Candidatus Nanoarchaeia archaeon]|nr:hypothetical protein [Candidatus Nanoarchaeia archaeon]